MYLHRPRIGLENKQPKGCFLLYRSRSYIYPQKKYPEVMMLSIRVKGNKKKFPVNSKQTTGCLITIIKALALIIQQEILWKYLELSEYYTWNFLWGAGLAQHIPPTLNRFSKLPHWVLWWLFHEFTHLYYITSDCHCLHTSVPLVFFYPHLRETTTKNLTLS